MAFTPPESYIAYAFTKKGGDLERVDVPWRDPQAGELVARVLACGVCASDDVAKYGLLGEQFPRIPGHEIIGEVVALGPGVSHWTIGQRVGGGWHGGQCNECARCRAGDFVTCSKEHVNGINRDGGYAEYVTLRSEAVASVPEDLDPAEDSLRHMDVYAGDIVAIQGIGGLGHLAIQYAAKMGFRTIALSSSESKHQLATALGASEYIDGSKEDQAQALAARGGAKVIMCTAPSSAVIQALLPGLAIGGQLLILAMPEEPATINLTALISKRQSIRGWPSGGARDMEDALRFSEAQGVRCMVQTFSLDQAQEAYEYRERARFRSVIIP